MSVKTVTESFENGKKFFEENHKNCGGVLFNNKGLFAKIDTEDRTYTLLCYIDADSDLVYMEVYPGIHVAEAYESQVTEYINKINAMRKSTNVRIAPNGSLYVHSEQDIENNAATYDTFFNMEKKSILLLDVFEKVLDKISNGRLLTAKEASVENVTDAHMKKTIFRKSFGDGNNYRNVDDADVDDDTDDIDDFDSSDEENADEGMFDLKEIIEKRRREFINKIIEDGERGIGGLDKEEAIPTLPKIADNLAHMNKERQDKSENEFEIFDVIEASLMDSSENNADNESCNEGDVENE